MSDDNKLWGRPTLGAELLHRSVTVVDLTREIYEGMPQFPLHQQPYILVNQTHDQAVERFGVSLGFEAHNLLMSEHTGTHTDAIFEYDQEGPHLDETPLSYYYGQAICVDLSAIRYPSYFTPEVLESAVAASGQQIKSGDIFLMYTGHGERTYPEWDYLKDFAGLSRDGAEWLANQGIVNIGVDAVSIDHADDADTIAHVVCKEFQIVNTEGLTNLDKLVGRRFLFLGLPLNIRGGTGSPIRAVALLDWQG